MPRRIKIGYARAVRMAGDVASYSLTGVAAGMRAGRKVAAAVGSYLLTGQDASFSVTTVEPAEPSGYVLVAKYDGAFSLGTSWLYASSALRALWTNPGGDYVDGAGVFNGPTPTLMPTLSATTTVDISGVDGDLFLHPNYARIFDVKIDGVYVDAFWTDPTSNNQILVPRFYGTDENGDYPNPFDRGVIIINRPRGSILTFQTPYIGSQMRIDKVRGPAIVDLPMLAYEGALPPDLDTLTDPITEAQLFAKYGIGAEVGPAPASIWAYDPSPGYDAATGLNYLRCAITPANPKGTGWRMYFPGGVRNEAYIRYCLWLEDSVFTGFNEQGIKLPGINSPNAAEVTSARTWHSQKDPGNPHLYALADYVYSPGGIGTADGAPGGPEIHFSPDYAFGSRHRFMRAGRWYCVEQRLKNNTFTGSTPNRDGILQQWLNGHLIIDSNTQQFSRAPTDLPFERLWFNIYHGGVTPPLSNMYYRVCKIACSTTRIGPPAELLAPAVPSWMMTETIEAGTAAWADLPNSTRGGYPTGNYAYSGACVTTTGVFKDGVFVPGTFMLFNGGGHLDSSDNGLYAYGPFESETPTLFVVIAPTNPPPTNVARDANNYPVSSHTYDGLQVDPIRNEMIRVPVGSSYSIGNPIAAADACRLNNNPALGNPWYPCDGVLSTLGTNIGANTSSIIEPDGTVWAAGVQVPTKLIRKLSGAASWTAWTMLRSGNFIFTTFQAVRPGSLRLTPCGAYGWCRSSTASRVAWTCATPPRPARRSTRPPSPATARRPRPTCSRACSTTLATASSCGRPSASPFTSPRHRQTPTRAGRHGRGPATRRAVATRRRPRRTSRPMAASTSSSPPPSRSLSSIRAGRFSTSG